MTCAKNENMESVKSLLSSFYHVLPYEGHCEWCVAAEKMELWNKTLKEVITASFCSYII